MKKINIKIISLLLILSLFPSSAVSPVYAQNVDCISVGLANYAAEVFQELGTKQHNNIKFLSPVFNMTNAHFPEFVRSFNDELSRHGFSINDFSAIAGNAYNTTWGNISDFVRTARTTEINNSPIILTEIGWYPHESNKDISLLKSEIAAFSENNVIGGLIFDVFGNNTAFDAQEMTDDEITEVCSGNCDGLNVGANSAVYYYSQPGFYEDAHRNNMKYTLEIANNDIDTVMNGINASINHGMTPIVRLGDSTNSGGFYPASNLISFIGDLKNQTSETVYVVIGPNEPLSESWATPECGTGAYSPPTIPIVSRVRPKDEAHFYIPVAGNEDVLPLVESLLREIPLKTPLLGVSPSPGWIPGPSLPGDDVPSPTTISSYINLANDASERTGVRASLILALIDSESDFRQFPGTGHYCDQLCSDNTCSSCPDCQSCSSMGNSSCPFIDPIQCSNLDTIWGKIGSLYFPTTKKTINLSAAFSSGCGGAMGPAQAMPSLWSSFEQQVTNYTGSNPASPWEYDDAFTFAGLHLKNLYNSSTECSASGGAATQSCFGEVCSVWRYMGGYKDRAESIVRVANAIAPQIGENSCSGWATSESNWQYPLAISDIIAWTSTAQDHLNRGCCMAWDFSAYEGKLIYPCAAGVVKYVGYDPGGYGNWVEVDHGDGWTTRYGHLLTTAEDIGAILATNNSLGTVNGDPVHEFSGWSTGAHLHFEIRYNGVALDPAVYLPSPTSFGIPYR